MQALEALLHFIDKKVLEKVLYLPEIAPCFLDVVTITAHRSRLECCECDAGMSCVKKCPYFLISSL